MKNYATLCLALLMAFAGVGLHGGVSHAADEAAPAVSSDYVQAYYFHATRRCATCAKLEQYSRESIATNFKDQLSNETLRYAEVNFDEPENRHFLQEYNLMYRALVLVRYKDGKQVTYKNLDRIWQLVRNEKNFSEYVKAEVEAMLKDL